MTLLKLLYTTKLLNIADCWGQRTVELALEIQLQLTQKSTAVSPLLCSGLLQVLYVFYRYTILHCIRRVTRKDRGALPLLEFKHLTHIAYRLSILLGTKRIFYSFWSPPPHRVWYSMILCVVLPVIRLSHIYACIR